VIKPDWGKAFLPRVNEESLRKSCDHKLALAKVDEEEGGFHHSPLAPLASEGRALRKGVRKRERGWNLGAKWRAAGHIRVRGKGESFKTAARKKYGTARASATSVKLRQ